MKARIARSSANPPAFDTFGACLRYLRRRARLTQRELAIATGYSPEHISRLEQNQRLPDPAVVQALFIPALDLDDARDLQSQLLALAHAARPQRFGPAKRDQPEQLGPLPAPLTRLIGRETALEHIRRFLETDHRRLLTLVGLGGSGKTRLAIATAVAWRQDGLRVEWVPLASVATPELLVPTIVTTLDLSLSGSSPLQQLLIHLRAHPMLLVLDNAEHLLNGIEVLTEILQGAPGARFLVTSRERLNLSGEWIVEVGGLDVPVTPTDEDAAAAPSVELFQLCAQRVRPSWRLTDAELPAVIAICRSVAGLPLGIELATSWLRVLSCEEIAAELARNMTILQSPLRDTPARHRSLGAVLDSSWGLLTAEHQIVLRRCAVFAGGCDTTAAAAVAAATPALLAVLIDKSLVTLLPDGRLMLHPVVQQYAYERLREAGETTALHDAHLCHFLSVLEDIHRNLRGDTDETESLNNIERDLDNFRAALTWAAERDDADRVGRMTLALSLFWEYRGHGEEARRWVDVALAMQERLPPTTRARILRRAGALAIKAGDLERGQRLVEASLVLFTQLGDRLGMLTAWRRLGDIAHAQHDVRAARAHFEASLTVARDLGRTQAIASALFALGNVAEELECDMHRARALFEESLVLRRKGHRRSAIAWSQLKLAYIVYLQGDIAYASELAEESLRLFRALRNVLGIAEATITLASIAVVQGDAAGAATLVQEGLALANELGLTWQPALAYKILGDIARFEADVARADACYGESLRLAHAEGTLWIRARVLYDLGQLALVRGDGAAAVAYWRESLPLAQTTGEQQCMAACLVALAGPPINGAWNHRRAARLYGAVAQLLERSGLRLETPGQIAYDQSIASLRMHFDRRVVNAAWQEGQAMTVEQTVAYVLAEHGIEQITSNE